MEILTVRDRPVAFRPTRWGGELLAVERGFFPVSSTGYRSLAGVYGFRENVRAADLSPLFLESLAEKEELERRCLLKRLARGPQPGRSRLGDFINVRMDAEQAINAGFFAPDQERPELWGGAYRLLCRIDSNPRFQPEPNDAAWTPDYCAKALEEQRELKQWIERLAKGDFSPPHPAQRYCPHSYFDLPPKPHGEKPFTLPAVTRELALDTPPRAIEPETVRSKSPPVTRVVDELATGTAAQMSLF
jgi:hypothetical protein